MKGGEDDKETRLLEVQVELDRARAVVVKMERALAEAKRVYSEAWHGYEMVKEEAGEVVTVEAKVRSYSHLGEGTVTVERRARFDDINGEEISEGTGAKLVLTKGDSRWEADLGQKSLDELLVLLNNPEEKKKRGRPTADAAAAEKTEEKPEPAAKA